MTGLLHEEKLRRALAEHALDGTEIHHVIDRALPGLEQAAAAAAIKAEIKARYSHSIPIDIAIEKILTLLETGGNVE
jgi:hypothetical protein